jgi:hypothetical protein
MSEAKKPFDTQGRAIVTTTDELRQALAAGHSADRIVVQPADAATVVDAALAAAEQGFEAERQAWAAERAKLVGSALDLNLPEQAEKIRADERKRILEIQALAPRGFEKLAARCIEDGTSIEQFALKQMMDAKDRGITLDSIKRDAPPAAPHAAPPAAEDGNKLGINAAAVYRERKAGKA